MTADTVLILADGHWGRTARLRRLAAGCSRTYATDGAWSKARRIGLPVDEVVGDLDSLPPGERERLDAAGIPVVAFPPEKDHTDLELALRLAIERGARRVLVFGALGGRLDHAVANLHLLEAARAAGARAVLISETEEAWIAGDREKLGGVNLGDRVSLLPLSASVLVHTRGLKYPLRDERLLRASSRGVSNVVSEIPVCIEARDGTLLIVREVSGGDEAAGIASLP